MPILTPNVPLAHSLPVLAAIISVVAAPSRFELGGCASRACSGTKVLTQRGIGLCPSDELHTPDVFFGVWAIRGKLKSIRSAVFCISKRIFSLYRPPVLRNPLSKSY